MIAAGLGPSSGAVRQRLAITGREFTDCSSLPDFTIGAYEFASALWGQ